VSCASAGNCAAGDFYGSVQGETFYKGFVVSEKNGVWGRAIEVPGLPALNNGGNAGVGSVSCLAGHLRSRQVLRGPLRPQQPPPGFRHL